MCEQEGCPPAWGACGRSGSHQSEGSFFSDSPGWVHRLHSQESDPESSNPGSLLSWTQTSPILAADLQPGGKRSLTGKLNISSYVPRYWCPYSTRAWWQGTGPSGNNVLKGQPCPERMRNPHEESPPQITPSNTLKSIYLLPSTHWKPFLLNLFHSWRCRKYFKQSCFWNRLRWLSGICAPGIEEKMTASSAPPLPQATEERLSSFLSWNERIKIK